MSPFPREPVRMGSICSVIPQQGELHSPADHCVPRAWMEREEERCAPASPMLRGTLCALCSLRDVLPKESLKFTSVFQRQTFSP